MKFADRVAKFIFNSIRLTSIMSGKNNMREQAAAISEYTSCPDPQNRITILSTIGVGDVLEPLVESVYLFNGDTARMSFRDKLVVYSISTPEVTHYLPKSATVGDTEHPKTTIILIRYEADTIDFDLSKIASVMCVEDHYGLMGLLTGFKLLGNIRDRMT